MSSAVAGAAGQGGRGAVLPPSPTAPPAVNSAVCNRCGFSVASRAFGCKNPCSNCGTVYPLGDCSD